MAKSIIVLQGETWHESNIFLIQVIHLGKHNSVESQIKAHCSFGSDIIMVQTAFYIP